MNDRQIEAEKIREAECVEEFRKKFETIMEEQNQGYHKALEWMFDGFIAEEGLDWFSKESFGYHHGIQHTELGWKVQKDIENLMHWNPSKYNFDVPAEVIDHSEILDKEYDPLFK